MVAIDAGALIRTTGVALGTFNAWVQRGLIPGMQVGVKGRPRAFDRNTVLYVAVMAELVALGYGASFAAMAATEALAKGADRPGAKLIIGSPRKNVYSLSSPPTIDYVEAKTGKSLNDFLDRFADGRPAAYTIVELDQLFDRVEKAFDDFAKATETRHQHWVSEMLKASKAPSKDKDAAVARTHRQRAAV